MAAVTRDMDTDQVDRLNAALAGRYAVEKEIGAGGMATVYLARDLRHAREVAIKVLRPELASTIAQDQFPREIDLVARLSHPHILPLYDSGSAAGFLFYVMPFVRGETLRHVLAREHRLPVETAVALTKQVASALEYAHGHGVIHRDIKPENILLHEGEAMIADFGIAIAGAASASDRVTGDVGLAVGTPDYMSPEQVRGDGTLSPATDVYSLGCVLFELLAGDPPFPDPSPLAAAARRLTDPVPDVRTRRDTVPIPVARALAKALARDPAERFASVGAFAQALAERAAGDAAVAARAIAVLPFLNLSPDPDNEYFADGITEDLIAQLSKIRALKVISRTSVMRFKSRELGLRQIAATLEAGTLVDGSVRRSGDRVRIVAQLVDGETDRQLWAETYDRQLTDVFQIQTEVALRIAASLQAELSSDEATRIRREPTDDVQAYQLYLQGRHCYLRYTAEGMRQSIGYYERAVQRDPRYALARVGIAMAYLELGESGEVDARDAYAKARDAAEAALASDPDLAEAHCALGLLAVVSEFAWETAEQEFRTALSLNPNSGDTYDLYGRVCSSMGRFDEAVEMERKAQSLDPMAHRSDLATSLLRAGRYEEALAEARRAVDFDPHYDRAHATLAWALARTGDADAGLRAMQRAIEFSSGAASWLAQLGQMHGEAGRAAEARDILVRLTTMAATRFVSPYHFAYVHTGLREYDAAIDWLERAYAARSGAVYGIGGSFLFEPLRKHPRFVALLKKINLA